MNLRNRNFKKTYGLAEDMTANQKCKIKIRAVGMQFDMTKWLESNTHTIQKIYDILQSAKEVDTEEEFQERFDNHDYILIRTFRDNFIE
jgi:hypothetical protein